MPVCSAQKWSWASEWVDDFMSRLLPIHDTAGGNGVYVNPVDLASFLICILMASSPSIFLGDQEIPLLFRDEHGSCYARLRNQADGYASKSSIIKGISSTLGCISFGQERHWSDPALLFKCLQISGKESGGNYRRNSVEVNDSLLAMPYQTILVPYGDSQVYEFRMSFMFGRDMSLAQDECSTGKGKVCGFSLSFHSSNNH